MNNIFNRIITDVSVNDPVKTLIVGNIQSFLIPELKKLNKKFAITTLSNYKTLDNDTAIVLSKDKFDFLIVDGALTNIYETIKNCKKLCNQNNIITIINFNIDDYVETWERASIELNLQKLMLINIENNKTVIWGYFILD